jgi:hypothetical protein
MAGDIQKMLIVAVAGLALTSVSAAAGRLHADTTITCENGRTYPLVPIAVSDAGDVVTAKLYTAPRRATHVRLIPMGSGYRYAGRGLWLDGVREQGVLNFGKSAAVACVVTPSVAW